MVCVIEETGIAKEFCYISTPAGLTAVYDKTNDEMFYVHPDHLGSIHFITDESGSVEQELSFDAWGRHRNATNWGYSSLPTSKFERGYTFHEHLSEFDLINMNGRVYDPMIARFLSPDPVLQSPGNLQNYNRYSYCYNNPLIYTDPSGELIWIIPNIGWSKSGGLSIGISVVVGIPGGLSAQAGIGYSFGSNDAYGYVGATAAMNTVYASYSLNSGGSVGYTAGLSPFSGLPISTNFGTVGVNYNISHNSWSGNVSAWQIDQNGVTFNPSVSVMVFPEQTTNFVRGQGFNNNNTVLNNFVEAGNHQGALEYFGFKGSYVAEDGVSSFWFDKNDPSKYGIRYRNGSFESYETLYSSYIKESFHMRRYEHGGFETGNFGEFSVDRWPEERQGAIKQYKNRGLHGDNADYFKIIKNTEGWINSYNEWGMYSPSYQYQPYNQQWWHFIYKVPRKW